VLTVCCCRERGALEKLSPHGWEAAETGNVDVGYVKWCG
jgi:hypothetical protein